MNRNKSGSFFCWCSCIIMFCYFHVFNFYFFPHPFVCNLNACIITYHITCGASSRKKAHTFYNGVIMWCAYIMEKTKRSWGILFFISFFGGFLFWSICFIDNSFDVSTKSCLIKCKVYRNFQNSSSCYHMYHMNIIFLLIEYHLVWTYMFVTFFSLYKIDKSAWI